MLALLLFLSAAGVPPATRTVPAFRGETAVVSDGTLEPRFVATRENALRYAGNPGATVFAEDVLLERIRITPDGASPLWLSCADLVRSGDVCQPRRRMRNGPASALPPPMARGLPTCPGDPRCPKL